MAIYKINESKTLVEGRNFRVEFPEDVLYGYTNDLVDSNGKKMDDNQITSAGFKIKDDEVYLPSGTYDAEWYSNDQSAPYGFSFKMKNGEWYEFECDPSDEETLFKVVDQDEEYESLTESTDPQDYRVVTVAMDVAMPADKKESDFGIGSTDPRNPLYNALSKALESVGLEMAGDYIDSDGDVTDVYKDNDYEFSFNN